MSLIHPLYNEGNTVTAFYKGWAIPAPIDSNKIDDFMKAIAGGANNILHKMLRDGETLGSAGDLIAGQTDVIVKAIQDTQATPEYATGKTCWSTEYMDAVGARIGEPGSTVLSIWFLNISCLLKLRRIKNDNENGFLKLTYLNTKKQ